MTDNVVVHFTLVLTDEKGYNIDRKFYKGNVPSVGDEIEFDGHIVTIEACDDDFIQAHTGAAPIIDKPSAATRAPHSIVPNNIPAASIMPAASTLSAVPREITRSITPSNPINIPIVNAPRTQPLSTPNGICMNKFVSPLKRKQRLIRIDPEELEDTADTSEPMVLDDTPSTPTIQSKAPSLLPTVQDNIETPTTLNIVNHIIPPQPKRARYGLSRPSLPTHLILPLKQRHKIQLNLHLLMLLPNHSRAPLYTAATLQFPSSRKALNVLKTRKYPKRTKVVPTKFANVNVYRDTFKKIIYEHLDILLLNYSIYFYSIYEKYAAGKQGNELERTIRAKGLGMYVDCEIKGDGRYQDTSRYRLVIRNKEHYSKYNKDDIWVISKLPSFEPSQTFLARSVYFGPFSDGTLEIDCISPRDARVSAKVVSETRSIYALRTISASSEFMMLDTLEDKLEELPLLRYILGESQRKKKDLLPPAPMPTLASIQLRRDDCVDIEARLYETIDRYKLNNDQENVLRRVASSVITAPGWNEDTEHPVVLVHGVYGSGKRQLSRSSDHYIYSRITGSSEYTSGVRRSNSIQNLGFLNDTVDRILQTLLKLGYDHFIRIGSMKKIAKNLLPFTAKARVSSNEELKELEQMLDDGQNSEEDLDHIATAIQRFRKSESATQIHTANVVGTTFMSSTFEIFNDIKFPLVLVDESSQLMEPLTMVPLARFSCNRLVMIGDPLQLPPTLVSPAEDNKVGKGLDKTLFDRFIECHPKISAISNKLFYDRRLLNGITAEDRKPLIEGLPTVIFVDVGGTEQKSLRTNSFWNDTEVDVSARIIQSMVDLRVPPNDLGVISLYKEQADRLSDRLDAMGNNSLTKSVQISTVDAFQGGEKNVIILSTVRTSESAFMHNEPRINVALTRAKRHLIILGNRNLLLMNELWSKIIWDCEGTRK
ncbi:hypothetical protein RO3G_11007 [Rhizopus delemar RA 99-880]|uniref:DNA2/NAM7 helicase-like C-terminal domain-containing protein n=1 Tax=Rhizopus delemar (strain RA 99-880 / ATCC MYA-4621 / FGSC 9543 / NRRL 43880) TaxID=246409 RepID=I1CCW6_RHIO9|nr:hypothetical protein RO3G_11007 [Rhizopus delemar RA 99-880]|eukprot:EIE86296.1 hypothetical protein RO3G_11007 [Rhizopus delemar RA 99-880]